MPIFEGTKLQVWDTFLISSQVSLYRGCGGREKDREETRKHLNEARGSVGSQAPLSARSASPPTFNQFLYHVCLCLSFPFLYTYILRQQSNRSTESQTCTQRNGQKLSVISTKLSLARTQFGYLDLNLDLKLDPTPEPHFELQLCLNERISSISKRLQAST